MIIFRQFLGQFWKTVVGPILGALKHRNQDRKSIRCILDIIWGTQSYNHKIRLNNTYLIHLKIVREEASLGRGI